MSGQKLTMQAHVATRRDGWGVRIYLKGCAAVWAGMGWKEGEDVPADATASFLEGFTWADRKDAEAYKRELVMEGRENPNDIDLHAECVARGLEISHWQSDLYIRVTPEAAKVIDAYKASMGDRANVTSFTGTDGNRWYEIAFAYTPFWTARGM